MLIEIHDFTDPRLSLFTSLTDGKSMRSQGIFIAESPLVIREALKAGHAPIALLTEAKLADQLPVLPENIPVYAADEVFLKQLTGYELTRGMLCAFRRPPESNVNEILLSARRVAVLENMMNATNIGAIFRSAAALNIDALLLTSRGADPYYRRASRVSMGTVFRLPWAYLPGDDTVFALHSLGFKTVAMALTDQSRSLESPEIAAEPRLAILLGTEGDGLLPATIEASDYTVMIPMARGVDSLNVSAAAAIAFYELGKKINY